MIISEKPCPPEEWLESAHDQKQTPPEAGFAGEPEGSGSANDALLAGSAANNAATDTEGKG